MIKPVGLGFNTYIITLDSGFRIDHIPFLSEDVDNLLHKFQFTNSESKNNIFYSCTPTENDVFKSLEQLTQILEHEILPSIIYIDSLGFGIYQCNHLVRWKASGIKSQSTDLYGFYNKLFDILFTIRSKYSVILILGYSTKNLKPTIDKLPEISQDLNIKDQLNTKQYYDNQFLLSDILINVSNNYTIEKIDNIVPSII